MMTTASTKQKIAVLGGGMGALSTVFGLTNAPDWQERYEITVYQMGWRLGGKGASGRNADMAQRIEEHGLHIWYGFYDNAFRLIQDCYAELNRPPEAPLSRWDDAFKPHDGVFIQEYQNGRWQTWSLNFPRNERVPGQGGYLFSPWGYVRQLLKVTYEQATMAVPTRFPSFRGKPKTPLPWLNEFLHEASRGIDAGSMQVATRLLKMAHQLAERLEVENGRSLNKEPFLQLARLVRQFRLRLWHLVKHRLSTNDGLRRLWIMVELATVNIYGMIVDGVIFTDFDVINKWDYREWLRRHGASDFVLASAPVRAIYDVMFAYPRGDVGHISPSLAGNIAAGVALHAVLLVLFSYKGAVLWKMEAGMGDVVFGPLYQVLKARGVHFAFFHKVQALHPHPEQATIEQIVIDKQAHPKTTYTPLVDVQGLPCWPSQPDYQQLVEGAKLQAQGVDLEREAAVWEAVERVTLQRGVDFDTVVLGIPVAALPTICAGLITRDARWATMVTQVKTVATQAVQLWLKPTAQDLGWSDGKAILDSFAQPFNTWSDMTQTAVYEAWPQKPGHIAYFCGPLADEAEGDVRETAVTWFDEHIRNLWPNSALPNGTFNWNLLLGSEVATGNRPPDRTFYWRANRHLSERYTLSTAGTIQHRLRSAESGFTNLYLAGDWTRNGLDIGCIEAAVLSGLQAAEAISGQDQQIIDNMLRV